MICLLTRVSTIADTKDLLLSFRVLEITTIDHHSMLLWVTLVLSNRIIKTSSIFIGILNIHDGDYEKRLNDGREGDDDANFLVI